MQTSLFGKPAMISRTGYTGERGYELFIRGQDAPMIWDRILDEGKSMGIIPCRFTTLDMLRTESYLLFFPFDNSEMYPFEDEGPGDTLMCDCVLQDQYEKYPAEYRLIRMDNRWLVDAPQEEIIIENDIIESIPDSLLQEMMDDELKEE